MKFAVLLKYKLLTGLNSVLEIYRKKQFSKIFFMILGILFLAFIYFIFLRFINYIRGISLIGPILISKFYEMIFIVFLSMLMFSSLIAGFNVIFSSKDMNFLTNLPLKDSEIYLIKYFETVFHSSWTVVILFIPVFLATGQAYQANIIFYAGVLINLVFLVFSSTTIGFFTSVFLIKIFPTRKVRDLFFVLGVLLVAVAYIFLRVLRPERLVNPSETITVFEYLTSLNSSRDIYLPSYWMTKTILLLAVSSFAQSLKWSFFLLGFTIITFSGSYLVFNKTFISISQKIKTTARVKKRFEFNKKGIIASFLIKDIKIFTRDTAQWSQMFILIALIIIYVFNIYKLPLDSLYLKNLVGFFNISMAGFVVASICLRFVFTSISLEGKSFWIVKASPVLPGKYILEKLILNGFPVIFVALPIVIVSNIVLGIKGVIFYSSILTIILLTIVLLCMAMGFGMMYPKFDYDNPVQIESSFGGILYMVYSFFLIAFTISIEAWPIRMYFLYKMGNKAAINIPVISISILILLIVYFITAKYSLKLGLNKLERQNI